MLGYGERGACRCLPECAPPLSPPLASSQPSLHQTFSLSLSSPLTCERSLLPRADGSARWTSGGTAALAAVYGPASTSARVEEPERGVVRATWRGAPVAGAAAVGPPGATPSSKALETVLAGMVRAALLAESIPRTLLSIDVVIEADDGGCVAAGLNAAAAALADAAGGCLPLRALPAAGSVAVAADGTLLADPTAAEEASAAGVGTFAFLTRAASDSPDEALSLLGGGGLAAASVSGRLTDASVLEAVALAGGGALAAAGFNRSSAQRLAVALEAGKGKAG